MTNFLNQALPDLTAFLARENQNSSLLRRLADLLGVLSGNVMRSPRLACLTLSVLTSSCGFMPTYVNLSKPSPVSTVALVKSPRPAISISIARATGPTANSTIGIFDLSCGGAGSGKIIVRDDPSLWVANAITEGLEQAGYSVQRTESIETANTRCRISIEVNEVSETFLCSTMEARVIARVDVYEDHRRTLQRTYSGTFRGEQPIVSDPLGYVLDTAMSNFLNQALPDLTAFLARENRNSPSAATPLNR